MTPLPENPLVYVKQLATLIEYSQRLQYNYYEGQDAYSGCETLVKHALIEIYRLSKL